MVRPELMVVRGPMPIDGRLRRPPELAVLLREDLPAHEQQARLLLEAGVGVVWVLGRTTASIATPGRCRRVRPCGALVAGSVPRLRVAVVDALGLHGEAARLR